jgi:hypothetical protein
VCGPLHVGKLDRQGRLNAVVPGSLVHIVDQTSNRRFLVDTGASYSIFPHTSSAAPSGPKLRGAAGQLIPCWGEKTFDLSFQGRRFSWTFLLAAVSFPFIGVDFLRHFKLMVDPAANALVDKCSRESFATISSLAAAAAADSGPRRLRSQPPSSFTGLLIHRPPQSPASSVTGLLSHRPLPSADPVRRPPRRRERTAVRRRLRSRPPTLLLSHRPLLSAVPGRWPPRRQEQTATHSCWQISRRWSTAPSSCPGSRREMWSTTS